MSHRGAKKVPLTVLRNIVLFYIHQEGSPRSKLQRSLLKTLPLRQQGAYRCSTAGRTKEHLSIVVRLCWFSVFEVHAVHVSSKIRLPWGLRMGNTLLADRPNARVHQKARHSH